MEVVINSVLDKCIQTWLKNPKLQESSVKLRSAFGNGLSTGAAAVKNGSFRRLELSLINSYWVKTSGVLLKVFEIVALCLWFVVFVFFFFNCFIPSYYLVNSFPSQDSDLGCTSKKVHIVKLLLNSEKTVTRTLEIMNSFLDYSSY